VVSVSTGKPCALGAAANDLVGAAPSRARIARIERRHGSHHAQACSPGGNRRSNREHRFVRAQVNPVDRAAARRELAAQHVGRR
jgi:hypothetical protein